jgi:hypothetical protein
MPLPVVSKETRKAVMEELRFYGGEPKYCGSMLRRLDSEGEGRNPVIAKFLFDVMQAYKADPSLTTYMVTCGFMVYRMFEMTMGEGNIPVIATHTGAPLQYEFFNTMGTFVQDAGRRVQRENFQVMGLFVDILGFKPMSDDPQDQKMVRMVPAVGLLVYRFLESQLEANQMEKVFV